MSKTINSTQNVQVELRGHTAGWGYVTDESISNFEDYLHSKLINLVAEAEARGRKQAVDYIEKNGAPEWDGDINDDDKMLTGYSVSTEQLQAITNHTV